MAVGADGELLRVRAAKELVAELSSYQVHDADPVGGGIGFPGLVVHVGPGLARARNGTAAEGDVEQFAIRAGMNAAGPFADGNGRDWVIAHAIDEGDVAGFLIADADQEWFAGGKKRD